MVEKLVVMGGVGEDEMKGKHVLLTTVNMDKYASPFSFSEDSNTSMASHYFLQASTRLRSSLDSSGSMVNRLVWRSSASHGDAVSTGIILIGNIIQ